MNNIIQNINYSKGSKLQQRKPHLHSGYQIIFVESGNVDICIEDAKYTVTAPSIILLNAFEQHFLSGASENYKRYILELDVNIVDRMVDFEVLSMLKLRAVGYRHVLLLDSATAVKIDKLFSELYLENQNTLPLRDSILSACSVRLLIELYRIFPHKTSMHPDALTVEVQKYIDINFSEGLSVPQLANIFFVSISHLQHNFKKNTGYSPVQYLIHTRLYHAQNFLKQTDFSIKKISLLCGYGDLNNFIRHFKKHYHLSPLQYRRGSAQKL